MPSISRGFRRRRAVVDTARIPPGQYFEAGFPVLTYGPTPRVDTASWRLRVDGMVDEARSWSWEQLMALPQETITVDIHCVTKWSKLDTTWTGVSLDALLGSIETQAEFVAISSEGGYTTNLPLRDLLGGRAWIAHSYGGEALAPVHGGPARLLVPHLYFWKSAKWVRALTLTATEQPGFWEVNGYHNHGDPWREERYAGD